MSAAPRPYLRAVEPENTRPETARPVYSQAFRSGAVALVDAGQPVSLIARQLGIPRSTLHRWINGDHRADPQRQFQEAVEAGDSETFLRAVAVLIARRLDDGTPARQFLPLVRLFIETMKDLFAHRDRKP